MNTFPAEIVPDDDVAEGPWAAEGEYEPAVLEYRPRLDWPNIVTHFRAARPPKPVRATATRAVQFAVQVSSQYDSNLDVLMRGGLPDEEWMGLDDNTVAMLRSAGWFLPHFDLGTMAALWADHAMSENERTRVYSRLWRQSRVGSDDLLLLFRLPPILRGHWRTQALDQEDVRASMPLTALYKRTIGIVRYAMHHADADFRLNLGRLNATRDHSDGHYFYFWTVNSVTQQESRRARRQAAGA